MKPRKFVSVVTDDPRKAQLIAAAKMEGKSLSAFMLEAGLDAARDVLLREIERAR